MIKNWWLLALCGILDAIYSVMNFFMQRPDGSLTLRTFVNHRSTLVDMGMLALAAGVCTLAAATWSSRKGASWLLALNGLACTALGLLLAFRTGPLAFRTIALLIVVMAMSAGIYELATARTLRRHLRREWLLGAAGVASVGFALAFLAFVLRWIALDPESPAQTLHWLGSYFGFSAICMLGMALALTPTSTGPALRASLRAKSACPPPDPKAAR
ncbi:MAG: DUF308 domain-containing protein [Bryobacteraceae bacterium]|jgi:uncharacterized membrane protein HdeD (DUF308 family)